MVEKHNHSDDEIVVEEEKNDVDDVELEVEEELSADKMKALRTKLRACEKEKQEHLDGWQRARADFLNYKRRTEEESERKHAQSTVKHVESLLPLLDSFALATSGTAWEGADAGFKAGFTMIRSQLDGILRDMGVETIDPKGESFDPRYHEALSEQAQGEASAGKILETIQKGYRIGDIVIRPARVVVGT